MPTDKPASPDDDQLLEQARRGSPAAVQKLFEHFAPLILQAVRRRLKFPVRRLVDSVDVMQDVRIELCAHPVPPEALRSPKALIDHLCVRARHKVAQTRRHYVEAQRRRLDRDVPLERVPASDQPAAVTPDRLAEREWWDLFERGLLPVPRRIFRLMRAGHTHVQIAELLEMSERTVERYVRKLKSRPPRSSEVGYRR